MEMCGNEACCNNGRCEHCQLPIEHAPIDHQSTIKSDIIKLLFGALLLAFVLLMSYFMLFVNIVPGIYPMTVVSCILIYAFTSQIRKRLNRDFKFNDQR